MAFRSLINTFVDSKQESEGRNYHVEQGSHQIRENLSRYFDSSHLLIKERTFHLLHTFFAPLHLSFSKHPPNSLPVHESLTTNVYLPFYWIPICAFLISAIGIPLSRDWRREMVGALSVMGSSVVDPHTSPCLCLDSLPSTNIGLKSSGDLVLQRSSMKRKQARGNRERIGGLVIVSELGGQYEDSFEDVKLQLLNYFTYKAVRTVLHQLYEMNPTQYTWFYNFVANNKPGDGKRFLRTLGKEKQDLAERVMVTRLHLYGKWVKRCDHGEIYKEISDENLELMRERLIETVIWPSDDTNTEKIG
ncbi:hypothetical protein OIU84_025518 [Salix udensis]|uniref:Chaperonin-like RbcX protein n=1 Tax=Salix udensis TaxID=889485 RepID=A0AAD6KM13_9ROSI|nr:hypothetical protein OIU84_025518 [Salix udensis]